MTDTTPEFENQCRTLRAILADTRDFFQHASISTSSHRTMAWAFLGLDEPPAFDRAKLIAILNTAVALMRMLDFGTTVDKANAGFQVEAVNSVLTSVLADG